jgi:Protein of unknown function (DUF1569)
MATVLTFSSLDEALRRIQDFANGGMEAKNGNWSLYKTLHHGAQSIEFSLVGYPAHKSSLFKNTAGKLALHIFLAKDAMSHDINMPIPDAPNIESDGDAIQGFTRLEAAVQSFWNHQGAYKEHFAYGKLTKEQYDKIQALHLANHLTEGFKL